MAIEVKEVFVEAYNSIEKMEWYYAPLYCAYNIISLELKNASKEFILQMAVKAVNNSAGLNRFVLMLFVFNTYLWITDDFLLFPFIVQWAEAICKAIKEVWHFYVICQINNALKIRNGLNTLITYMVWKGKMVRPTSTHCN